MKRIKISPIADSKRYFIYSVRTMMKDGSHFETVGGLVSHDFPSYTRLTESVHDEIAKVKSRFDIKGPPIILMLKELSQDDYLSFNE